MHNGGSPCHPPDSFWGAPSGIAQGCFCDAMDARDGTWVSHMQGKYPPCYTTASALLFWPSFGFEATPSGVQGLLWALCSEFTPGRLWGALWGTVNETQIGHVQSKRPLYCPMVLVPIKHCFKGEIRLYALSSLVKKKKGGGGPKPLTTHLTPAPNSHTYKLRHSQGGAACFGNDAPRDGGRGYV